MVILRKLIHYCRSTRPSKKTKTISLMRRRGEIFGIPASCRSTSFQRKSKKIAKNSLQWRQLLRRLKKHCRSTKILNKLWRRNQYRVQITWRTFFLQPNPATTATCGKTKDTFPMSPSSFLSSRRRVGSPLIRRASLIYCLRKCGEISTGR